MMPGNECIGKVRFALYFIAAVVIVFRVGGMLCTLSFKGKTIPHTGACVCKVWQAVRVLL